MNEKSTTVDRPARRLKTPGESFFVRYGFKIMVSFLTILIFLTCVRCTVEKPESPIWTTTLTIPVINRTYKMSEIITDLDQAGLTLDASDTITFSFDETLDTIKLTEDLTLDSLINVVGDSIGKVTIQPAPLPSIVLNAGNFGISTDIPGFPLGWLNEITIELPSFDLFNWATISTGSINIEIINKFGISFDIVAVDLLDRDFSRVIATNNFPGTPAIPDNDTALLVLDLAGRTISDSLALRIRAHTTGTVDWWYMAGKSLTATVGFAGDVEVSAAETQIPAIPPTDLSESVALESDHTILTAYLSSGDLSIILDNNSNLTANLSLALPDFKLDGNIFTLDTVVAPQSTNNIVRSMTGYIFEPVDQTSPQQIDFNATATLQQSAQMIVIDENDDIQITIMVTNLAFDSMSCILSQTTASFDNLDSIAIDVPEGFDDLRLANAVLELEITNGFNFPGTLNLTLSGDGSQTPLNISGIIPPGTPANPTVKIIVDSNLSAFLNPVPSYVTVSGSATFGDGVTSGTITLNDFIVPRISLSSPLEVIIDSATFAADTTSESIDQEDVTMITEHLIEAGFNATIDNNLPLGVLIKIYLDGDSTQLNDSAQVVKIIEINADALSQVYLSLDSTEIKVLENDPLYITQDIILIGNGIDPVMILKSSSISILATIDIEYRFNGDF